jgi:hypothetical protein
MNTFKKILGFLLIYGIGTEYIEASRQLGSPFNIGIIIGVLLVLILCALLIGSSFSKTKFEIKSLLFLKYFGISFIVFFLVAYIKLMSYAIPDDFVIINDIKIPLNKCIDGSIRIIPNEKDRIEYCTCLAEKLTSEATIKQEYKAEFEKGRLDYVMLKTQHKELFFNLGIENCMNSIKFVFTESLGNSLKKNWKRELEGTAFEISNDLDNYCDCLITEYRKLPSGKIMKEGFLESEEGIALEKKCSNSSLKK